MWLCLVHLFLIGPTLALPVEAPSLAHWPLYRRTDHNRRSRDDLLSFATSQANAIKSRYGVASAGRKRQAPEEEILSNLNADSQYFGTIDVGTPAKPIYIVLDTGSADLWIAEPSCSGCPSGIQTYTPSASSTSQNLNTPFEVTYGSGQAIGQLYEDVVTLDSYSVSTQTFAGVNDTTGSLLTSPVSGLMGFGWRAIASSKATPWWTNAGITEFGFALTRFQNDASASVIEPGGIMVVNGVNASLYTGSINYIGLTTESFWLIPLEGIVVSGKAITNSSSSTAIDTGTTLIGGPSSAVAAIYAAIPGSKAQSGAYEGYYSFPCSSNFTVSLTFGGVAYPIASTDFNLGVLSGTACLGAIFSVDTSPGQPDWIVGDSFLKSYYTTFRASPPAVGFASLSSTGASLASNDLEASLTTSSVAETVATPTSVIKKSDAYRLTRTTMVPALLAVVMAVATLT